MRRKYPIYIGQLGDHCGASRVQADALFAQGRNLPQLYAGLLTFTRKEDGIEIPWGDGGCEPENIVDALRRMGFFPVHIKRNGTLEMLTKIIKRGLFPHVCYTDPEYQEDHWATVVGVNGQVELADPYTRAVKNMNTCVFYDAWTLTQNGEKLNNTIVPVHDASLLKRLGWLKAYA